MHYKFPILFLFGLFLSCTQITTSQDKVSLDSVSLPEKVLPVRNQQVIDTIVRYGATISPTYKTAVCTELVISIVEKFYKLSGEDKSRVRIITNQDIQTMLKSGSSIPKGVYYALTQKGIGMPVDSLKDVLPGDFVQFWTETWGHCGVVKSLDLESQSMELYSSFPWTDGYGIQRFRIPQYTFFVRLK